MVGRQTSNHVPYGDWVFQCKPVHAKLPADIVLFLTPEKHLVVETSCHQHIRDGVIDVPANEKYSKADGQALEDLISKKYIKGDSLLLPRNMIQESLV